MKQTPNPDEEIVKKSSKKKPGVRVKKVNVEYSKVKRILLHHVTFLRILIILFVLLILSAIGFLAFKGAESVDIPLYFNIAYNFINDPVSQLASYNGRTNILIMGKAGGDHDGPDLTDTMMLVSVSLKSNDIKTISIPRDMWIPEMEAKINSAYYWGNQKTPGGGIAFAKAETSEVLGVPIQYGAVIDFSGFQGIIDDLGGIEVNVANSFTDYYYPIAGKENDTCGGHDPQFMCRYQTVSFKAGPQEMNGTVALEFVRSRHAAGMEGSDLAREARQQKVIDALKTKLLDKNTYKDPKKDLALLKAILGAIQTDIDYPTAAILARQMYNARNSVSNYLIPDYMLSGPPISKIYDMQSVFIPRLGNGKWTDINNWVISTLK